MLLPLKSLEAVKEEINEELGIVKKIKSSKWILFLHTWIKRI